MCCIKAYMLALVAGMAGVIGMMFYFTKTKHGRRVAKKARRIGKDARDFFADTLDL